MMGGVKKFGWWVFFFFWGGGGGGGGVEEGGISRRGWMKKDTCFRTMIDHGDIIYE